MQKKKELSVTSQMLEEKRKKIANMKDVKKQLDKGVNVRLSLSNHLLLHTIASELDEKVGRFASELLARSVQVMAVEMGLGEPNFETGEIELYEKENK